MPDRPKVRSAKMRWWDRMQMLLSIIVSTITQTMCQCQWLSNSSNNNKWQPTRWWARQTWADISIYRQLVSIHHQIPLTILIDFVSKKNDIYHSLSLSLLCELNISSRYCQWIAQKCESVSIGMCSHVFCHHCIVFGVQTIYIYIYQFIHSTCPNITTTYRPNPTYFDTLSLCLSLFNILRRFLI